MPTEPANRRDFLKAGAVASAAAILPTAVHAAGTDVSPVGVSGTGGRGSGAAKDCLEADKSVRIVAVGDYFADRARGVAKNLAKGYADRVQVGDKVFGGLDAYKGVLAADVDLVILATPPGFRPTHLEAAIAAGKHIFCEKPVAVDGAGIRKCLELAEKAKEKKLAIVAGTQRRHQAGYLETVKRIQDGEIGDIVGGRCAWNDQGIWYKPRQAKDTDLSYQINNWYHYLWLCGDHIVEQHVHNLDVMNWVLGAHPVKAVGFGGRGYRDQTINRIVDAGQRGDPNVVGQIWDHFAVDYTYPKDVVINSTCTHIPGVTKDVSESVVGTKGRASVNGYRLNKKKVFSGEEVNPYVQEHVDLINCIKSGKAVNELQQVAESTMTAILGRMACYSGQTVTWEQGLNSKLVLMPAGLSEASKIEITPAPVPDKYKV